MIPFDIAGAQHGRIAIVGSSSGATCFGGWIATFAPDRWARAWLAHGLNI